MYGGDVLLALEKTGGLFVREIFGFMVMVLAVFGVVLNNRMNIACFYVWMVSNAISAALHYDSGMMSMCARDVIFMVLAVDGVIRWRKKAEGKG